MSRGRRDSASARSGAGRARPSNVARAKIADRPRQLVAARRRFAEPERNRRRRALRVRDAHHAGADLQDLPRGVAELEDVAGVALDREVLVERADEGVVRIEDDAVVGDLGDRAAGGDAPAVRAPRRPRSRALTSSRWTQRARRPRLVAKPSAASPTTASKLERASVAIRPGAADQREQLVFAVVAARRFRRRSAAPARRAARRATTIASSSPRRPRAAAPRTRPGRRATPGTAVPSASLRSCVPSARPAAAAWRSGAAIRSGRRDRRGRCRCRARARRWPPAPAAGRSSAASRRRAASPSTGCRGAPSPLPRRAAR